MRKKKFILPIILLLFFVIPTSIVQAKNTEILIDGEIVEFNNSSGYPFVDKNNRTLVPFRITLEKFGAKVAWDNTSKMAIAEKDNIVIKVPIGKNYIFRNDEKVIIDTISITKDGRTYLPIRPVIEAFNGQVAWNSKSNSVIIKSESLAQEIHYKAWEDVATKALSQAQDKYGIYVSRSMAVMHPEIYLQADRLFYEKVLNTEPESKPMFENKSKNYLVREDLITKLLTTDGLNEPLHWSDVDIKEYKKMTYGEFYSKQPFLDFIDIRMYALATALQPTDMKMLPLNMAEIVYFQEKDLKGSNPYILMSENGDAYVWSNNKLLSCDGKEAKDISEKIVLIFNEDFVWYPLMERDDRKKDDVLKNLVDSYTNENSLFPKLTEKEIELIDVLKKGTNFNDENEEIKAKYYSSRIYVAYLRYTHLRDFEERSIFSVYDREKDEFRQSATCFLYYSIFKKSNYLSPVTSYYASMAKELEHKDLNTMANIVVDDFHLNTNAGKYGDRTIAALTLWGQIELSYANIDDTWLSKLSNCIYSTSNAAAIFELANIKGLDIIGVMEGYSDDGGGHIYLSLFKDGDMRRIDNFAPYGQGENGLVNFGTSIFRGFAIDQDWVMFLDEINNNDMIAYTSRDKSWVVNLLNDIKSKSDSKAIIVNSADAKTKHLKGINIVDFINGFNPDKIFIHDN